ncbi:putative nudix hydrolase 9-like isoform X2 [Capsicum annuum]|nr:putative nudix hydrolase 9-like isoform X2 [Capsicum annuum]
MEEKIGHGFKLLISCPSGLSHSQVSVVFDEAYDPTLELSISEIWDARVQQSSSLYNGTKFRYSGYNFDVGNNSKQQPHVSLHLGLTDYRWQAYNSFAVKDLVGFSADDCIQCQNTSSPLGNGAVVETSDKRILVLQRSNKVGEFPGYFVFPGDHPELRDFEYVTAFMQITRSFLLRLSCGFFVYFTDQRCPALSVKLLKKLELLQIPFPIFIDVSRRVLNVRPTAFFFIKCNLQSDEIQQLYSSAQDGFE